MSKIVASVGIVGFILLVATGIYIWTMPVQSQLTNTRGLPGELVTVTRDGITYTYRVPQKPAEQLSEEEKRAAREQRRLERQAEADARAALVIKSLPKEIFYSQIELGMDCTTSGFTEAPWQETYRDASTIKYKRNYITVWCTDGVVSAKACEVDD